MARLFSPAIVVGGSKNLANGLARVAAAAGARGLVSSEVTHIEASGGGFALTTRFGGMTKARAVVSTLDPRSTFLDLMAPELAPAELREAASNWIVDGAGPFTAHFGIKGDPPGDGALIRIFGFGGADEVDLLFATARRGELPETVAGHLTVVSAHDPLQASPGPFGPLHTLRMQTHVPFELPEPGWDRMRTSHRTRCWDALVAHFPDLARARLAVPVLRHPARHRAPLRHQPAGAAAPLLLDRTHADPGSLSRGRCRAPRRFRVPSGAATTSPRSWPRISAWSGGGPSPSYSESSSSMAIEVGLQSLIGTMS